MARNKTKKINRLQGKRFTRRFAPLSHHPTLLEATTDVLVKNARNNTPVERGGIKWRRFYPGRGGSESRTDKISQDGYIFVYSVTGRNIGDEIICLPKDTRNVCFKITFDKESQSIAVSIGYSPDCSINKKLPVNSGTKAMLKVVMRLILGHPDIKDYRRISLDDMSAKFIASHEDPEKSTLRYRTDLMDMKFLSTGTTWYATIAPMFLYRPIDDENYHVDKMVTTTVKWREFLDRLPFTVREYIEKYIVGNADELASIVLNRVRTERKYSIIFHKFMKEMLQAMGVNSMYGKSWSIAIRNGRILATRSDGWEIPPEFIHVVTEEEYERIKKDLQEKPVIVDISEWPEIDDETRLYDPSEPDPIDFNAVPNNVENVNMLLSHSGVYHPIKTSEDSIV